LQQVLVHMAQCLQLTEIQQRHIYLFDITKPTALRLGEKFTLAMQTQQVAQPQQVAQLQRLAQLLLET
jgi:hypothetical protein